MQTGKSISELINEAGDKKIILIMCESANLELEKETHRAIRYVMEKSHIPFDAIGVVNVGMSAKELVRLPEIHAHNNLLIVVNENPFEEQIKQNMNEIVANLKLTAIPEHIMIDPIIEKPLGSKNAKTKHLPPPSVKKGHVKPKFTLRGRHR